MDRTRIIEEFRQGYPGFCALIETHPAFHVFLRFSKLRAQIILREQDKLSMLEQQLDSIDQTERSPICLACNRLDSNDERKAVMDNIEKTLHNYDDMIERNRRILNYEDVDSHDISSLRNWVRGNACLARVDSAYLDRKDLFGMAANDGVVTKVEALLEDLIIGSCAGAFKRWCNEESHDPHVYIPSGGFIGRLARVFIAVGIIVALLVPVVVCSYLTSSKSRIIIVAMATIIYVSALVMTVQVRTIDVIVAGSTYATVLTVFVSGSS